MKIFTLYENLCVSRHCTCHKHLCISISVFNYTCTWCEWFLCTCTLYDKSPTRAATIRVHDTISLQYVRLYVYSVREVSYWCMYMYMHTTCTCTCIGVHNIRAAYTCTCLRVQHVHIKVYTYNVRVVFVAYMYRRTWIQYE